MRTFAPDALDRLGVALRTGATFDASGLRLAGLLRRFSKPSGLDWRRPIHALPAEVEVEPGLCLTLSRTFRLVWLYTGLKLAFAHEFLPLRHAGSSVP